MDLKQVFGIGILLTLYGFFYLFVFIGGVVKYLKFIIILKMIYLLETSLPETKSIFIGLQKIYGINKFYSSYICKQLGVTLNFKIQNLSFSQKLQLIKKLLKTQNLCLGLN